MQPGKDAFPQPPANQDPSVSAPVGGYYLSKTGLDGHRYRIDHALALQKKVRPLEQKRDEAWRAYTAAKEIETQKGRLLDQVEARLGQQVT